MEPFAWPIHPDAYRRGLLEELDMAERAGKGDRAAQIAEHLATLPEVPTPTVAEVVEGLDRDALLELATDRGLDVDRRLGLDRLRAQVLELLDLADRTAAVAAALEGA